MQQRRIDRQIEILERAAEKVEKGWVRGAEHSPYDFDRTSGRFLHRDRYCAVGSVKSASRKGSVPFDRAAGETEALLRLQLVIPYCPIIIWNDTAPWRSGKQVARRLRLAAKMARVQRWLTNPMAPQWWEAKWLREIAVMDGPAYTPVDLEMTEKVFSSAKGRAVKVRRRRAGFPSKVK